MKVISIIICSRKSNIPDQLESNIKETIGVSYELTVIDNSTNKYSIFEAYNLGLDQSTGDFICFLHDDIFMQTSNWGKIVKEIFLTNPRIGLLGIAGGKLKTKMPSAWWEGGENTLRILQHYKNKPKELWCQGFNSTGAVEVAAIDGVFMVMRKDEKIRFDERLSGFHNYDLNLSILNHNEGKKVLVTNRILLEHFSEGKQDKAWYESTSLFHKLYKNNLPIVEDKVSKTELKNKELTAGYRFITKLIEHKLYREAIYWWFQILLIKPKWKNHLKFIIKYV